MRQNESINLKLFHVFFYVHTLLLQARAATFLHFTELCLCAVLFMRWSKVSYTSFKAASDGGFAVFGPQPYTTFTPTQHSSKEAQKHT